MVTAKAKGLTHHRVLYGHVFRNAMLLVIAGFPSAFIGIFFTGSLLVEVIFSLDGLALMRLSRFKLLSWTARVYVSFFRGTPLLVQLFLIYYGLPQVGIELDPIPAAMIGFSLNMAAYASEKGRGHRPSPVPDYHAQSYQRDSPQSDPC